MRILIANDDGVDAPGLALLHRAASSLSDDVWVVAPERKWTAASHQLSFDRDLTLTRRQPQIYALNGAPADCVVGAMTVLFRDAPKPDLMLSGVNDGRNAGEDAAYSGTLAIAREATFWGIPAIGFSRTKGGADDAAAEAALSVIITHLWAQREEWRRNDSWLSVNLPKTLPARAFVANIGRDKIASAADIIDERDDRTVWRIRRGRQHTTQSGDENSVIDAGCIAIARHGWRAAEPLAATAVVGLNAALQDGDQRRPE